MTRTANTVGTEAEGRSAQNPVDRQVGEAVAWRMNVWVADGIGTGWTLSNREPEPSHYPSDIDPLIPASDLEQVTRERDEAVAALEKISNPPYGLGFNRLRGIARQALASLRSMEKG